MTATWQETLADALIEAGVEVAAWVPDKRLAPIGVRLAERGVPLRTLTREEECFGFAAVAGDKRAISLVAQDRAQHFRKRPFVIDDEDRSQFEIQHSPKGEAVLA